MCKIYHKITILTLLTISFNLRAQVDDSNNSKEKNAIKAKLVTADLKKIPIEKEGLKTKFMPKVGVKLLTPEQHKQKKIALSPKMRREVKAIRPKTSTN